MHRLNSRIGSLVSLIAMLVIVTLSAHKAAFAAQGRAQAKISINMITSWSKHKAEDAQFLVFMHSPARLQAFFTQTGGFAADDRFNTKQITDPLAKTLFRWDLDPRNVWLENFVPTQVDSNGDQAAGEMITSGSGDVNAAAQIWERTTRQWRVSNPSDLKHFQAWIGKAI